MKTKLFTSFLILAVLLVAIVPPSLADNGSDTSALRAAVTLAGVRAQQQALQNIANANGGVRVAGTTGHEQSANYVDAQLTAAGYSVTRQYFDFPFFEELAPPVLEQISPNPTTYVEGVDFFTMQYSGSGDVTATIGRRPPPDQVEKCKYLLLMSIPGI